MCVVPVTDHSCVCQEFKDPEQLQPEEVPPFSALLVLKAHTGFHFNAACVFISTNFKNVNIHIINQSV